MSKRRILTLLTATLCGLTFPSIGDPLCSITIDASQRFQRVDGFGVTVEGADWVAMAELNLVKETLLDHLCDDLDISIVRVAVKRQLLAWKVEDWTAISHEDFKFTGDSISYQKSVLESAAAIYKRNPNGVKVVATVFSPPFWMKDTEFFLNGTVQPKYRKHFAKYLVEWIRFVKEEYGLPIYAISPHSNNDKPAGRPYLGTSYEAGKGDLGADFKVVAELFEAEGVQTLLMAPGVSRANTKTNKKQFQDFLQEITNDPEAKKHLNILALHGRTDVIHPRDAANLSKELTSLTSAPVWISQAYGETFEWQEPEAVASPVEADILSDDDFADDLLGDLGAGEPVMQKMETYEEKIKRIADAKKAKDILKAKADATDCPPALSLGVKMHHALEYLNARAYIYAYATGSARHPKMGFNAKTAALMGEDKPSKKSYVFMHFSRFIRPGAVRVSTTVNDREEILATAFVDDTNETTTVVLINQGQKPAKTSLNLTGAKTVSSMDIYQTTGAKEMNCKAMGKIDLSAGQGEIILPPLSITTLHGNLK